MRHTDFAPFYRSTVGFDHLFRLLDGLASDAETNGYPPYNIERVAENQYRISMAVAGFNESELAIDLKESTLTIRAERKPAEDETREYLHRGIAQRSFERRFQLADHVEVSGADLKDGMLHINLVRNLPERMKPRSIPIRAASGATRQIEATSAAA